MSAAATAAGYLYASGRLRGRGSRDEHGSEPSHEKPRPKAHARKVRVEVYQPEPAASLEEAPREEKPKRVPKIAYRTRRWTPNE